VMNTHDELEQAYLDYNAGKYGVLEWWGYEWSGDRVIRL
jgi:asparagine N-glycosylation enzyme membrane subunit Stt3